MGDLLTTLDVVIFFGSLIATYLAYRGQSLVGPFPHTEWTRPDGSVAAAILDIPITSISAFVLLMSSVAMVIALDGFVRSRRFQARLWLFVTALEWVELELAAGVGAFHNDQLRHDAISKGASGRRRPCTSRQTPTCLPWRSGRWRPTGLAPRR